MAFVLTGCPEKLQVFITNKSGKDIKVQTERANLILWKDGESFLLDDLLTVNASHEVKKALRISDSGQIFEYYFADIGKDLTAYFVRDNTASRFELRMELQEDKKIYMLPGEKTSKISQPDGFPAIPNPIKLIE